MRRVRVATGVFQTPSEPHPPLTPEGSHEPAVARRPGRRANCEQLGNAISDNARASGELRAAQRADRSRAPPDTAHPRTPHPRTPRTPGHRTVTTAIEM